MSAIEKKSKLRNVIRYEIRHYPDDAAYSVRLGRKLRTRQASLRLVRRIKDSGVQAFAVPIKVCLCG